MPQAARGNSDLACDCGSGKRYADCCLPLHKGLPAPSAEALMRSRYTAYARELTPYLLASWHTETRPESLEHEPNTRWLGLKIRAHLPAGDTATVRFEARYRVGGGRAVRLRENSSFVRENGHWYYVNGDVQTV